MSEIWRFLWPAALLMAFSLHGLTLDAYGQSDCITATSPNTMTVIFPEESLNAGEVVRARSAERDLCAGQAEAQDNGAAGLTVRGDDTFEEVIGFDPNEPFDLFLDSTDGTEQRLITTADMDGSGPRVADLTFQNGSLYVVGEWQPAADLNDEFVLSMPSAIASRSSTVEIPIALYSDVDSPTYTVAFDLEGAAFEDASAVGDVTSVTDGSTVTLVVTPPTLPEGSTGTLLLTVGMEGDTGSVTALSVEAATSTDDGARFASAVIAEDAAVTSLSRFLAGDVAGSGSVGPDDLVELVAWTLGTVELSDDALQRADVSPWPDGDGAVDLRDVHTLAVALNEAQWPDGEPVE